jgi:hypothetical protein
MFFSIIVYAQANVVAIAFCIHPTTHPYANAVGCAVYGANF